MGLKQTALAIGIAIVFTVFISYGLWALYEPPKHYYEKDECWQEFDCEKPIRECQEAQAKEMREEAEAEDIKPLTASRYDDCYNEYRGTPEYVKCMEEQD